MRIAIRPRLFPVPSILAIALASPLGLAGQATAGDRILGTISAVGAHSVTVREASGQDVEVALSSATRMLRAEPGAKTLQSAAPLAPSDLAPGDRVLIRTGSGTDPAHPAALLLVAMKGTDLAAAHAREAAEWEQNGVAGIVTGVDASSGVITLKQAGAQPPLLVHSTSSTVVRQYAPTSTLFADAHPAQLAAIKPGDQLRARGARTGNSVAADEIVAGSFRDIAGTVLAADAAAGSLTLLDLKTKKPLELHIGPHTQLRMLPQGLAERLAHREEAGGGSGNTEHGSAEHRGGGLEATLEHAPSIQPSDLKKGAALLVVASGPEAPEAVAITVLAGVEPLLQAPAAASNDVFSASWNLSGGDAAESEGAAQR